MSYLRDELQETLSGSYTIDRELGGGGMSRVFLADELRLGRKVVVKVLSPELAAGISAERFKREMRLAASLQQANIVPVLSSGEVNGLPYFTMPFVEGESLRKLVGQGPLSINDVIRVLGDVARALQYAHERGIVHRDIKPDNVLLSGGTAVVTDFGIAKALQDSRSERASAAVLTLFGTSVGTPAYMAPEQAAGDPHVDHRADIYSFGCTAYELLVGHAPFHNRSPQRVLAAHMGEVPQPITELRPDTPAPLAEMVMRCLAKEPSARLQAASDIIGVLNTVTNVAGMPALPSVLIGGPAAFRRALIVYALTTVGVALATKAATIAIGLPRWAFPGALILMALGLPVVLFTGYAQQVTLDEITKSLSLSPDGKPKRRSTIKTLAIKAGPHMSWKRITHGNVYALSLFAGLVVGFMALRALGIGPAASLFAAGRLSEKDRILVADFRMSGGDSSLAAVVTEAVRTSLGQSPVLSILSPVSVADALARMAKPTTSRLTLALARELALREGVKAVVDGDVTPLASGFVVSLRLVTADSGVTLAAFHGTADGPRDLLPTIDDLALDLREKAGESLKSVQANPPLEKVTTPSFEALRLYALAVRLHDVESNYPKAVELLKQATRLDTAFGMAYRKLAAAYINAGYPIADQTDALQKAMRYRDRMSDVERLTLEGYYYTVGAGHDRVRGIASLEAAVARFPRYQLALATLARACMYRGDPARADSLFVRVLALEPSNANTIYNITQNDVYAGRVTDAVKRVSDFRERTRGVLLNDDLDAMLAYAARPIDSVSGDLQRIRAASSAINQIQIGYFESQLSQLRGRLGDAERAQTSARAGDAARGVNPGVVDSIRFARFDAWFRGQPARAVRRLDAALAAEPLERLPLDESRPDFDAARAYALAGRPDRARWVLAQFAAALAADTALRRWLEPYRRRALGEIALAEGKPVVAIDELMRGARREDGPVEACPACNAEVLGWAYDRVGQSDSAIAHFERYVAAPDPNKLIGERDPMYLALALRRLGELYEAKPETTKAIGAYARFIELWKNADAELQPQVSQARQRLARLQQRPR